MVSLIRTDLEFILEQIVIAERHAAGESLLSLLPDPTQPHGLRTVDGTYNNLVPGNENLGAADTVFPRSLTPTFGAAENNPRTGAPTSYAQNSGSVYDSQPRTISNLIADQTTGNHAALSAPNATVNADGTVTIPNVTTDAGLSAPFNGWMTLFGQFFDHGLDLVAKGGSGTVFIPLKPDDPLYVSGSPSNFMVLTRATNQPGADGVLGTADDVKEHLNTTTSYIDQNQTYTSHPSHQVFLREYEMVDGKPLATGKLLDGADGGLVTWAEVKAQARNLLGIDLTDADVGNIPLLATDPYGEFIRGPNGFAQVVMKGADGIAGTADDVLVEGNPAAPIGLADAARTGHAFLDDIAHAAVPVLAGGVLQADADTVAGNTVPADVQGRNTQYDNELLDAHYVTGDGRGNENIGLTSVHHVFHSEHNRLVEHIKDVVLATGDAAFIAQWQLPDGGWDGERIFQAARFSTEMQYQHLVFEEFARRVQPNVDLFDASVGDIDPSIVAEFAHTVYRFGHSMLTDTVARVDADGTDTSIGLIEAFLNPLEFKASGLTPEEAAGAIVRGMTQQVGNEIDEFTVEALRNNLVGLPLDLPALNIARGRETGVPSLNEARRQFFAATDGDTSLKPYESWEDFGFNLKNPASLVNFVAAYGTHSTVAGAATLEAKRAAAFALVLGGDEAPADRLDFMTGTGAYADGLGGLEKVDLWIGGLAEKQMPFGGLLGSTFGFVFETQMERLQEGDRFYYLSRTAGTNFLTQLESSTFAELVMRNTDAEHLHFNIFATPHATFEVSDPTTWNGDVVRIANGIRYTGGEHVVMGGSENAERLVAGEGDDALWGDGGNDTLEGGFGNDALVGGEGDDTLTDTFGDDIFRGDAGNDSMNGGLGIDLMLGGAGDDYINGGAEEDEVFAGEGNDIVLGGDAGDELFGNEGHDWMEGGNSGDLMIGDNNHPLGLGTVVGHDVMIGGSGTDRMEGEEGNDIFVGGDGLDRHLGQQGFDWVTYFQDTLGITADLTLDAAVVVPLPPSQTANLDRFGEVEGLSGTGRADALLGDDVEDNAMSAADIALIDSLGATLGATSFAGGNVILGGAGSDRIEGRGGDDFIDGDAFLSVRLTSRAPGGQIVREVLSPAAAATALDVDSAVFSGARAEYDIVRAGAGSATVAHARGAATDGTDTLRNVEVLRFADGAVLNAVPAGSVRIAGSVEEDATLTASYVLADAAALDGLGVAVSWLWQAETAPGAWAQVGAGASFTPGDALIGVRLRAVATFTDALGTVGSAPSAPTAAVANVNEAPTGTLAVSDTTPTERYALTGSVLALADGDGLEGVAFSYQWQSSADGATWTDIAGATAMSFTPRQAVVGHQLRFTVAYTDNQGTAERVVSAATSATGDRFDGGAGNDAPALTASADVALGGAGDDTLRGLAGDDTLWGGTGNDLLDGGAGDDAMRGQEGDDTYVVDGAQDLAIEYLDGGTDTVETTLLAYTLQANMENLAFTGTGDFTGTGNALRNTVRGGGGADSLGGAAGNDTLDGGAGADTLRGGSGDDRLVGGAGNDLLAGDAGNDVFVFGAGFGNDQVQLFDANPTGGQDLLDVSALGITSANFAQSVAFAQSGANTLVSVAGGTITLVNVAAGTVTQADFILA